MDTCEMSDCRHEEVRVLATDGTDVFDSEYMSGNWEWCADVTHWMPLPEPPEVT
jgi:hypothetical protein